MDSLVHPTKDSLVHPTMITFMLASSRLSMVRATLFDTCVQGGSGPTRHPSSLRLIIVPSYMQ